MKNPKCPNCKNEFTWLQSFEMMNPWNFKCKIRLETGWVTKLFMILALPFGLALAGVAIWQEEAGNWDSLDSQLWFFGVFVVIGLLSYLSWPACKFKIKGDA